MQVPGDVPVRQRPVGLTGRRAECGVVDWLAEAAPVLSPVVPSNLIGPLYFESSLITDHSFVSWGSAVLPSGPGLGVELDREALARHRTDR